MTAPPSPPAGPPPPPPTPAARKATPDEIGLSNGLIAGAFGFIGLAALVAPQFVDKVEPGPLKVGAALGAAAVVVLLASIIVGGRGQRRVTPGPGNAFARQALFGLAGVASLCLAGLVFAFNPKQPDEALARRLLDAEVQVRVLTARLADHERTIDERLKRLETQRAACPPSCPPRPPPPVAGS